MQRYVSEGYLANWAARLFFQAMDRAIRPQGLTPAYVPVLLTIGDQGEVTQSELATAIAIEQPTMAGTLARMERDGLVERRTHAKDRRKSLIRLTAQGREKIKVVREAVSAINAQAVDGFSEEERKVYRALMRRIIDNLGGVSADDQD